MTSFYTHVYTNCGIAQMSNGESERTSTWTVDSGTKKERNRRERQKKRMR